MPVFNIDFEAMKVGYQAKLYGTGIWQKSVF